MNYIFIRPVEPSDVEPLLDMLLASDQFDEDGIHHVRKTLNHYFSGHSTDLWFSENTQDWQALSIVLLR